MVQATVPLGEQPTSRQAEAVVGLFKIVRAAQSLSDDGPLDFGARRLVGTMVETGPVRLSDLAREAQLDLSTVSRHVVALQSEGIVRRTPDPQDRRACLVELTDAGVQWLHQLIARRVAAIAPVVDQWPAEDRERLYDLLIRLSDDLRAQVVRVREEARP